MDSEVDQALIPLASDTEDVAQLNQIRLRLDRQNRKKHLIFVIIITRNQKKLRINGLNSKLNGGVYVSWKRKQS